MTFDDICDEVIATRFREGQRGSVKRWVNHREAMLWSAAEWPFKHVGPTGLSVLLGNSTPSMPDGFERTNVIFDDTGADLLWMAPNDFDRQFREQFLEGTKGRPVAFKCINRVVTLGPIPDIDYAFTMSYERRMAHLNGSGQVVIGPMTADDDSPIYDSAWHMVLVMGAVATGLKLENDPTYPGIEEEYNVMLQAMRETYLPSVMAGANLQYGRDELGVDAW